MFHEEALFHVHPAQPSPGAPDPHCESDSSSKLGWEGELKSNKNLKNL